MKAKKLKQFKEIKTFSKSEFKFNSKLLKVTLYYDLLDKNWYLTIKVLKIFTYTFNIDEIINKIINYIKNKDKK